MVRVLKYNEAKFKITQLIKQGGLQPGDKLASERELAEQLGMSIISVRRALAEFQSAGIVRKVSGIGTFYNGNLDTAEEKFKVALINIGDSLYPGRGSILAFEAALEPYQAIQKTFYVRRDVQSEVLSELRDFDKLLVTGFVNSSWLECLGSLGKPILQVGESEDPNSLSRVEPDWQDAVRLALRRFPEYSSERIGWLLPDPASSTYGVRLRQYVKEEMERFHGQVDESLLIPVPLHAPLQTIGDFLKRYAAQLQVLMVESGALLPLLLAPELRHMPDDLKIVVIHESLQLPADLSGLKHFYQVCFQKNVLARAAELLFEMPCDFFAGKQADLVPALMIEPRKSLS